MKNLMEENINKFRRSDPHILKTYGSYGDKENGLFTVPSPIDNHPMVVLASVGEGWEHVSVSRKNRIPNWIEMQFIKNMFFSEDQTAIQYHVPDKDHINVHNNCLHLWVPIAQAIPLPPKWMVA